MTSLEIFEISSSTIIHYCFVLFAPGILLYIYILYILQIFSPFKLAIIKKKKYHIQDAAKENDFPV